MLATRTPRLMLPAVALSALLLAAPALAQTTTGTTTGTGSGTTSDSKPFRNLTEQQRVERLVTATKQANPDSTTTAADIQAMRAQHMGWGVIAQKLGLHPSVVGLGSTRSTKGTTTAKSKTAKAANSDKGLSSKKGQGAGDADDGLGPDGGLGRGGGFGGGKGSGGGRGGGNGGGGGGGKK